MAKKKYVTATQIAEEKERYWEREQKKIDECEKSIRRQLLRNVYAMFPSHYGVEK